MIVLGIDQSYNSSGIIVLEGDTIIHSECFKSNKNFDRFGQAHEIATHIADLLDIHKPDIVAIEGLAFGMSGNVTRDLGGLQFVIVAHLQEVKKQPVKIVAPSFPSWPLKPSNPPGEPVKLHFRYDKPCPWQS